MTRGKTKRLAWTGSHNRYKKSNAIYLETYNKIFKRKKKKMIKDKPNKNEFIKKTIKGIEIDVRSKSSLYITIGKWVIYIDNSTGEQIIESWID